jgi:hypothetical protein
MSDIKAILAESARILAASRREAELTAAAFGITLDKDGKPLPKVGKC